MINFFRIIRRQLVKENKFRNYFKYAFGEVVIIMLGIFFALQLQIWNEKRKKEALFKVTLEQLYNTITDDASQFEAMVSLTEQMVNTMDLLLELNDTIPEEILPMGLWSTTLTKLNQHFSETTQILQNLEYNPGNEKQNYLAKQLMGYGVLMTENIDLAFNIDGAINEVFLNNNIFSPAFDYKNPMKGFIGDSTHYSSKEISSSKNLLKDQSFRTLLKTQHTLVSLKVLDLKELQNDAVAMLGLIKRYHPEVKLLYQDIGIIGTSINGFDDVGAKSTPMTLTDEEKSIWEIEMYLKQGKVKFRCRDSWAINWGGNSFPEGKAIDHGGDITIPEAGNYRVILNLTDNTYEFIELKK
ncbi:MAG: hypothetical protein HKO81_08445 [Flavobacteriaceae bacterium]|nr:hypothetical protein [Bacteroidia bacterium]NNL16655.1 hypothetical protein [Flavobacteriaceae bacterium]